MKALCFGSLNIDYTYQVDHFVQPGESLASRGLQTFPGGKGLNQAIALSRSGVETWIAGAIGPDGRFLMDLLEASGVHTGLLMLQKDAVTGQAIIQRTPDGENGILLFNGANHCICSEMVDRVLQDFDAGDLLMIQNEISCVPEIVRKAHEKGMTVALNASPVDRELVCLPENLISILLVNASEAAQLVSLPPETEQEALLQRLEERYPDAQVVMTIGAEGAWILTHGRRHFQPAFPVHAVDTTSAGDTFAGFYTGSLLQGSTMAEAAERAAKAAAICVTREGASPSIPTLEEVLNSDLQA